MTADATSDTPVQTRRATRELRNVEGGEFVDALVAVPDGVIHVRAINREGQRASEIVATALDADGRARAPARLLRRTTGPVRTLDLSTAGTSLWIAWGTIRPEGDAATQPQRAEFIIAAMRATLDLASAERAVTIEDFRAILGDDGDMAPQAIAWPEVGVVAADDGGARIIAVSPMQTCEHEEGTDHASREPCRAWSVTTIAPDGRKTHDTESALAMTRGPYGLLRIANGYVYAVDDDHVGSKAAIWPESFAGGALPLAAGTYWHYRDLVFATSGGAVYARGTPTERGMREAEGGHIFAVDVAHAATTPIRHGGEWGDEWPALTRREVRCAQGHPVIALRWETASVTLDPTTPGTNFRWEEWMDSTALPRPPNDGGASDGAFPLAWAGHVLVGAVDGALLRWRCDPRGTLALAP